MIASRQLHVYQQLALAVFTNTLRGNLDLFNVWTGFILCRHGGTARRRRLQSLDIESQGLLRLQIHHAHGMIVGIGDVEFAVSLSQTTWFVERRRRSIRLAGFAVAKKRLHDASLRIEFLDLVIVSVGDQYLVLDRNHSKRML